MKFLVVSYVYDLRRRILSNGFDIPFFVCPINLCMFLLLRSPSSSSSLETPFIGNDNTKQTWRSLFKYDGYNNLTKYPWLSEGYGILIEPYRTTYLRVTEPVDDATYTWHVGTSTKPTLSLDDVSPTVMKAIPSHTLDSFVAKLTVFSFQEGKWRRR